MFEWFDNNTFALGHRVRMADTREGVVIRLFRRREERWAEIELDDAQLVATTRNDTGTSVRCPVSWLEAA